MLKIKKDLESTTNSSIKRVAEHLIATGEQDSLIAQTLDKAHKSLDGAWKYIQSEARKSAIDGAAMIEDVTVYGWAQHYYDEDSLDFEPKTVETKGKGTLKPKVVEVELPEEDNDVFNF